MSVRAAYSPPILSSEGSKTNPTTGTLMADSGAVVHRACYELRLILTSSVASAFTLARRNAANDADVTPFPCVLRAASGQSSQYALLIQLEVGERVVVKMGADLTGQAQAFSQLEEMV